MRYVTSDCRRQFGNILKRLGRILPVFATILTLIIVNGCSRLTGWEIPGTEKSAQPTTKVYFVLENVESIPLHLRTEGEIYVDDAFFRKTSRPEYSRFVGNALVVGNVRIEKEKIHTIKVVFPAYEPFEHTRYFGTLPEYSVPFRLKRMEGVPLPPPPEPELAKEQAWYEFWK